MALDLGTIASLATALTLVVALVFGVIQVRLAREQRRHMAVVELIHQMQSAEIVRPIRAVMDLPIDTPASRIAEDPGLCAMVNSTVVYFEGLGLMAHSRVVDLHDLDRAAGGVVRGSWKRVRAFIEASRAKNADPSFGEWFQWLAERMEADPAPGKAEGAHVAFIDWKR